jgi:hypothetical protein
MRRRPAADGHQSQEDEGQQRSADDTYEVATSPQLARRFQSVSHKWALGSLIPDGPLSNTGGISRIRRGHRAASPRAHTGRAQGQNLRDRTLRGRPAQRYA